MLSSLSRTDAGRADTSQAAADTSREFAFLLACVRRFFQPGTSVPSAAGLDWPTVVQLAEQHRVVALFAEAIRSGCDIPPEIVERVRSRARDNARLDLTLNAELTAILQLFEAHEIQSVALKGPLLGAQLYGTVALRSSSDLDLLVRPEDLLRAKAILEANDYRMESALPWPVDRACLFRRDNQISFTHQTARQSDPVWIDLHWRLLPPYFPQSFDEGDVWRNPGKVRLGAASASVLPPEQLLLFLCAHGTKHVWDRLGWICDIARLLHVEPQLDWSRVFTQARRTHTGRMLKLGLSLASEMLGASLPSEAAEYAIADSAVRPLVATVRTRLHGGISAPAASITSALFTRRAFERLPQRVRFTCGVFQPTEAEYQLVQLPLRLHWVYYPFRVSRLAVKYIRLWGRGA